MDVALLEGIATALYKRLHLEPDEPVRPLRLAKEWLGADAVRRGHVIGAPARIGKLGGRWTILVRPTLPPEYLQFYIAHELGHALLAEEHYDGEDEEAAADRIGGALMAPMPAMRRLYRTHGLDLGALASAVTSTQTWAGLRVGEAIGTPIAVVSPEAVRVRGPESFVWPAPPEIRRMAKAKKLGPGLAKAKITDSPGRIALIGDEDVSETG